MGTVNVNLRWDIPWVKGLNAYVRGTFDDNHRIEKKYSTPVTLYTYDATTEEFAIDQNTVYPKAKTTLEQTDRFYKSQLYEAGINYNNTFAAKHTVGATLVMNYQRLNNQYMIGINLDKTSVPETMGTVKAQSSMVMRRSTSVPLPSTVSTTATPTSTLPSSASVSTVLPTSHPPTDGVSSHHSLVHGLSLMRNSSKPGSRALSPTSS